MYKTKETRIISYGMIQNIVVTKYHKIHLIELEIIYKFKTYNRQNMENSI